MMIPYILILLILVVFSLVKKERKEIFIALAILLFLFAALRGNGSGDYFTYKKYSTAIITIQDMLNNGFPMEFGFRIIAYIVNSLHLDSQWVIILMNITGLGLTFSCIYLNSRNKILSLLVFFPWFLTMDMHAARTAVAAGFGLWAIFFFIDKKVMKYLLFVAFAAMFHKTSILLLILPIINIFKTQYLLIISGFIYMISIFIDLQQIPVFILNGIGLDKLAYKLLRYVEADNTGYPLSILDPRVLLMILIIASGYYFYKYLNDADKNLLKVIGIGFIAMMFFRHNTFLSLRLSYYFLIVSIVFVPNLITIIEQKKYPIFEKVSLNTFVVAIYTVYGLGIIYSWAVPYLFYQW